MAQQIDGTAKIECSLIWDVPTMHVHTSCKVAFYMWKLPLAALMPLSQGRGVWYVLDLELI